MDIQLLSFVAGTISSLIFAGSYVPMLWKVAWTRDVRSYSWPNIMMANIGNLVHWLYVISLPPGPVWVLHTFYTLASLLLLVLYLRFRPDRKEG